MTQEEYQEFVQTVIDNIVKHGFPDKKVAFPLEKMYESAYNKGLNFNKVLRMLDKIDIGHQKTPEKVIFHAKAGWVRKTWAANRPNNPLDPSVLAGLDPSVLAGLDPSVFAGLDPSVLAGLDPSVLAGLDPSVLAGLDPSVLADRTRQHGPAGADSSEMTGLDMKSLMAAASAMMQTMNPEQLESIKNMAQNLTDEDRAALLEQARKMGLFK